MNIKTTRSIAFSILAATATLTFAAVSAPAQTHGMCVQRGLFQAQVYAPRVEGQMVQLGVPGMRSLVFAAGV